MTIHFGGRGGGGGWLLFSMIMNSRYYCLCHMQLGNGAPQCLRTSNTRSDSGQKRDAELQAVQLHCREMFVSYK